MSANIQTFQFEQYYIRQTTIDLDGSTYLHSINDEPSLIISLDPIDMTLLSKTTKELSENQPDLVLLMIWTDSGIVHRDNNYALFLASDDSNISFFRYWVHYGIIRAPNQGFAYKDIFYSYSGNPIDCTIWSLSDEPIQLKYVINGSNQFNNWDDIIKLPKLIFHNEKGPAIKAICRDPKEHKEQMKEAKFDEYDIYYGPFPINEYYLNGLSVSSEDLNFS